MIQSKRQKSYVIMNILVVLFFILFTLCYVICTCPLNYFKLKEITSCRPLLECKDIENMRVIKRLGTGGVKDIFLMKWMNTTIVLSTPVNLELIDDFLSGVDTLQLLNPSEFVVQFLGFCRELNALLTEYHPLGSAADFFKRGKKQNEHVYLNFCYQYAQILNFLHNSPEGKRVFCDTNDLDKLLSQLLITTENRLILNDVDALPEIVNNSGVKCGRRQLFGSFVAPEQLWLGEGNFNDDEMPAYDEKTDIWKAASVCEFFLKQSNNGGPIRYKLFNFHAKCKSRHSSSRPSAEYLVKFYKGIIDGYGHPEL